MKALMASTFPSVCDAAAYRKARAFVRDRTDDLRKELEAGGFVDSESGMLTTGVRPFNVFARQAAGAMALPKNMVEENKCLEASGHAKELCWLATNEALLHADGGSRMTVGGLIEYVAREQMHAAAAEETASV